MLNRHRYKLFVLVALMAFTACWVYWNRTSKADMSGYVPDDALAFIEASDLIALANGVTATEAWRVCRNALGVPAELIPHRWSIGLARWTGIGSAEAVLLAAVTMCSCICSRCAHNRERHDAHNQAARGVNY